MHPFQQSNVQYVGENRIHFYRLKRFDLLLLMQRKVSKLFFYYKKYCTTEIWLYVRTCDVPHIVTRNERITHGKISFFYGKHHLMSSLLQKKIE